MRILLIEDEAGIADFVMRGLREEGLTVEHAEEAETGWLKLTSGPWDVVLLDWRLPGADGLELLRRFGRKDQLTPILFLTARDAVSDRVQGLDSGADDYLCKPFSFTELLSRIVRSGGEASGGRIRSSPATMSTSTWRPAVRGAASTRST